METTVLTKKHLPIALGLNAFQLGYNIRFYTTINLATELVDAFYERNLSKREKYLTKFALLIIDEVSYLTFNQHQVKGQNTRVYIKLTYI